jgi:tRNA A-37 threonylcarbamoyl transferase component Bud32
MSLQRSHDGSSREKIVFDCDDVQNTSSTQGWLESLTYLQTIGLEKAIMSHKKILEAILDKKHIIVIKLGDKTDADLKVEFANATTLHNMKVPGVLEYYCYFECHDDFKSIGTGTTHLCDGTGSDLHVLMMEYIPNKSLGEHAWKDPAKLRSCLKQVLCTLLDAHLKCGFVHGDFHAKNVLFKPTKRTTLTYTFGSREVSVETHGVIAKLMDFELSTFDAPVKKLFRDVDELFSSIANKMTRCAVSRKTLAPIRKFIMDISGGPMEILELMPLIDSVCLDVS